MRYARVFVFIFLVSIVAAWLATDGWARALWVWTGLAYGAVAVGYFRGNPHVFGKRPDGSIPLLSLLFFAPYLMLYASLLGLFRLDWRHRAFTEIAPEIQLGCRLQSWDRGRAAPLEIGAVLDMTAECLSIPFWRGETQYLCLPTLDATAPTLADLRAAVQAIDRWKQEGRRTYIHCAFGHGRSATALAAYLLHAGEANTAEDAVAALKARRPGVRLSKDQWAILRQFAVEKGGPFPAPYDKLTV